MATAKMNLKEQTTEETLLAQYRREGRAEAQLVGLDQIIVDHKYQARVVSLNLDQVSRLQRDLRDGSTLHRVILFRIAGAKKLILAHGFHRYEAHKRHSKDDPGAANIPAWIIDGDEQEATAFAACCNQITTLPRTAADIKRAVFMLLDMPIWNSRSDNWIASHVRCTSSTVKKYRVEHSQKTGIKIPDRVLCNDGGTTLYARDRKKLSVFKSKTESKDIFSFSTKLNGKHLYLGRSQDQVSASLEKIESRLELFRSTLSCPSNLAKYLIVDKICAEPVRLGALTHIYSCLKYNGFLVATMKDESKASFDSAITSLVLLHKHLGQDLNLIIAYPGYGVSENLMQLLGDMGIKVLTPDELVEHLKGDGLAGVLV